MRHDDAMTIALITGTSSGIGLHAAIGLARSGLDVVATVQPVEVPHRAIFSRDA